MGISTRLHVRAIAAQQNVPGLGLGTRGEQHQAGVVGLLDQEVPAVLSGSPTMQ
jgi:hypothetical protein